MRAYGFIVVVVIVCAAPFAALAQSDDLRTTIRGMLLSDPRSDGLSGPEISAVVEILAQEATTRGITSQDIQWRPQDSTQVFGANEAVAPFSCGGSLLCIMTEAFGFIGVDTTIPFTLGAASMGLVWILAEMLHRHRHPVQRSVTNPVSAI